MKRKTYFVRIRNLVLSALMLFTGSCLDYTVETKVNTDGSIFRQYWVRGDSTAVFDGSLRIPAGDPWHINHIYDNKEKDDTASEKSQYVYQASRTFKDVKELNDWMNSDTSAETVKVKVDLQKKFKWFYTHYEYREVFPMSFPFRRLPVDSFLTEMEQSIVKDDGKVVYSPTKRKMILKKDTLTYYYSPADSATMKQISEKCQEKMVRWMTASFIEEYIHILETDFHDLAATKEIRQKADEFTGVIFPKVSQMSLDTLLDVRLLASTGDSLIGSGELKDILTRNPEAFRPVNDKIEQLDLLGNSDDYYQSLSMPGTVFSTNADQIKDETLFWDFDPDSFLMKDYVMTASSRVANPWTMGFTAIVAVFLGIVLFKRSRRN
jgi:hypothetical protein